MMQQRMKVTFEHTDPNITFRFLIELKAAQFLYCRKHKHNEHTRFSRGNQKAGSLVCIQASEDLPESFANDPQPRAPRGMNMPTAVECAPGRIEV